MDQHIPVVGIQVFPGDGFIRPVDLGRAVEDRGFGALFFPQHLHMPVDRTVHLPRPVRELRPDLVLAEAVPPPPRPRTSRRLGQEFQPDPALGRRLDPGSGRRCRPSRDRDQSAPALAAERRPDFDPDITVAVGCGRDLTAAQFEKLRAAQVTRILLAIDPGSYEETTAALDQAASIAK
jgi:hypothetical protein